MAWSFGDGFDLYATTADAANGYWDASSANPGSSSLVAGRFTGSRALNMSISTTFIKTSGVNDVVHHFVCGFMVTSVTGANLGNAFTLYDGTTAQCSVVFRTDGAILLTSGIASGTILATYTGASPAANTWYGFEFEVVINNATGSFTVRRNGNPSNDFQATGLNTRLSTNNYANQLRITSGVSTQNIDDFFWRSDAVSVAWMGDIRCYTRMPSSNVSTQLSASGTHIMVIGSSIPAGATANRAWYSPYVVPSDGTIGSATLVFTGAYTGNTKCTLFNDSSGAPGTILATATNIITNPPALGSYTFTFSPAATVTNGQHIWMGICQDTTNAGNVLNNIGTLPQAVTNTVTYASFPVANPTGLGASNSLQSTITVIPTSNYAYVSEAQEDGLTTYVYDNVAGHNDLYGVASIGTTPATVYAVTTRGYMQKSDAGSRTANMQTKSGTTTVDTPTLVLSTGWQWAWRTDLTDPNTGSAWVAGAVDSLQIGPTVVS